MPHSNLPPKRKTKSTTSSAVKNRWNRDNYDRFTVTMPKGDAGFLLQYATARGESRNAFVRRAILGEIERDRIADQAVSD